MLWNNEVCLVLNGMVLFCIKLCFFYVFIFFWTESVLFLIFISFSILKTPLSDFGCSTGCSVLSDLTLELVVGRNEVCDLFVILR